MNKDVYLSVLAKLSTVAPLMAKALLENALKKRGYSANTVTPIELIQILRDDINPKLSRTLHTSNSILLAGAATIITNKADKII